MNPGDVVSDVIVSDVPPWFTIEKTNGELAVSTDCGLKVKLMGDDARTPAFGADLVTVTASGIVWATYSPIAIMVKT